MLQKMLNFNNFLTFGTGSAPVQIRDPLLYNGASLPGGEPGGRPARHQVAAQMRMILISTAVAGVASPIMIIIRVTC